MALLPFQPQGPTLLLPSTAAAATTVQPSSAGGSGAGSQALRVVNLSTNDAYVAFSASSSVAASVPSTAAPSTGHTPVMQRTERVFTTPPLCWVSAITTAGQANLALTPGYGGQ